MSLKKHLRVKRRGRPRKAREVHDAPTPETLAKLEVDVVQVLARQGVFNAFQEEAALAVRSLRAGLMRGSSAPMAARESGARSKPSNRDCFDRLSSAELKLYRRRYVPWEESEKALRIPELLGRARSDLLLACVVDNRKPQELALEFEQPLDWIHAQLQQSVNAFMNRS